MIYLYSFIVCYYTILLATAFAFWPDSLPPFYRFRLESLVLRCFGTGLGTKDIPHKRQSCVSQMIMFCMQTPEFSHSAPELFITSSSLLFTYRWLQLWQSPWWVVSALFTQLIIIVISSFVAYVTDRNSKCNLNGASFGGFGIRLQMSKLLMILLWFCFDFCTFCFAKYFYYNLAGCNNRENS